MSEEKLIFVKTLFTGMLSLLSWALGGIDILIKSLLFLIVVDYITGLLVAIKKKTISSAEGFIGVIKKAMIFLVVIISNILDVALLNGGNICRTITISFYITNELISLLENFSSLNIPIPQKLQDVLKNISKDDNKE